MLGGVSVELVRLHPGAQTLLGEVQTHLGRICE